MKKNNKVYYGEYSIEYWINLLISGNITLPSYQRSYVWKLNDVTELVKTIKENRFIPPITIGSYTESSQPHANYIVDGQQRLTSVLLSAIGYFPNVEKWKSERIAPVIEDPDSGNETEVDSEDVRLPLEWTYKALLGNDCKTIEDVRKYCASKGNLYTLISDAAKLNDNDLKNCYIGFCYLIPDVAGNAKSYYADVFMDINGHGIGLSDLETRRSLYFLCDGLEKLIEPDVLSLCGLVANIAKKTVGTNKINEQIDFIKYLSIMDEYLKKVANENLPITKIAVRYKNDPQTYYKEFILVLTGRDTANERFYSQEKWHYQKDYARAIKSLEEAVRGMEIPMQYDSIVDMDVAFFGLVYWVCYCGKQLDGGRKNEFLEKFKKICDDFRNGSDVNYLKSASQIGKLRGRIEQSVALYKEFLANG